MKYNNDEYRLRRNAGLPLEEANEGDPKRKQRNYAVEKQKEREPKYAEGWKNFSVMVPPEGLSFLHRAYESFKKRNPHLFDIESDESGEETE